MASPFANYNAVFAGLETGGKRGTVPSTEASVFPEALLTTLVRLLRDQPYSGVTKLYDEFILQ